MLNSGVTAAPSLPNRPGMERAQRPFVRKEVNTPYRHTHRRRSSKALSAKTEGLIRPGIKLFALVSILGISAYLLFMPENTEFQRVKARQPNSKPATRPPVQSPAPPPAAATQAEPEPIASPTAPVDSSQWISGLPTVLKQASPSQQNTADRLRSFVTTGNMSDIRDLTPEDVRSLAELLTTQLGAEAVAAAVQSYLGLPAASFLAHGNAPEALTELFQAVQTEADSTTARPVVFSDQVRPDGSVSGNVHVIPAGTKRVYAVFENAGALQGRDHVLAVWRDPSDDRMVFTEYEPVRAGAAYNYVWLQLDQGWPAGFYRLDLFNPSQPTELLASRCFNVR